MTPVKPWQERTQFNGPCYPPEAQAEITDLRAAVERKDALLRDLQKLLEGGDVLCEVIAVTKITKELE